MSTTHEERIAELEKRVTELERLLLDGTSKKAKTSSVRADCDAAAKVDLPLLLAVPRFLKVWQDFCAHRCRLATKGNINNRKHPWTPRAAKAILKTAEGMGVDDAIEAMNLSIDKEWVDIFPPEQRQATGRQSSTPPARPSMRL